VSGETGPVFEAVTVNASLDRVSPGGASLADRPLGSAKAIAARRASHRFSKMQFSDRRHAGGHAMRCVDPLRSVRIGS